MNIYLVMRLLFILCAMSLLLSLLVGYLYDFNFFFSFNNSQEYMLDMRISELLNPEPNSTSDIPEGQGSGGGGSGGKGPGNGLPDPSSAPTEGLNEYQRLANRLDTVRTNVLQQRIRLGIPSRSTNLTDLNVSFVGDESRSRTVQMLRNVFGPYISGAKPIWEEDLTLIFNFREQ